MHFVAKRDSTRLVVSESSCSVGAGFEGGLGCYCYSKSTVYNFCTQQKIKFSIDVSEWCFSKDDLARLSFLMFFYVNSNCVVAV